VWRKNNRSGWKKFGECKKLKRSRNVEKEREKSEIRSGVMDWKRDVKM
jgi:hypothetical protein